MKNLNVSYLLDFYGNLLSDKQREILELYYQEDLSLSEIAEITQMTRQGVHDNIKRGEKEILAVEDKLELLKKFRMISAELDRIDSLVEQEAVRSKVNAITKHIRNII